MLATLFGALAAMGEAPPPLAPDPKAACPKCSDRVPVGKRIYYASPYSVETCAFCKEETEPREAVFFHDETP